jgi:hypothetical protein
MVEYPATAMSQARRSVSLSIVWVTSNDRFAVIATRKWILLTLVFNR